MCFTLQNVSSVKPTWILFANFNVTKVNSVVNLLFLKEEFFISCGGARWYTSEHRLQIHLQQPIQGIWIHSRYLKKEKHLYSMKYLSLQGITRDRFTLENKSPNLLPSKKCRAVQIEFYIWNIHIEELLQKVF